MVLLVCISVNKYIANFAYDLNIHALIYLTIHAKYRVAGRDKREEEKDQNSIRSLLHHKLSLHAVCFNSFLTTVYEIIPYKIHLPLWMEDLTSLEEAVYQIVS